MKKVWMQPSVLTIACMLVLVAAVPAHAAVDALDAPDRLDAAVDRIRIERHGAFIDASPRAGDLRLRILFSRKFVEVGNGFRREDRVPLFELIDAARGSTDPLTLQLLYERCRNADRHAAEPCDVVPLARRWVEADAQNQIAWIELATALEQAGDLRGADDAWARAALASTFRDPYFSIVRLLVRTLPATADPLTHYADFMFATTYGTASAQAWSADLYRGCKNASRKAICAKIADTIDRDADTFMALFIGQAIRRVSAGPDSLVVSNGERSQFLQWALLEGTPALWPDRIDLYRPATLVEASSAFDRWLERGEIVPAREALRRLEVSDPVAVRKQIALLEAQARASRAATKPAREN